MVCVIYIAASLSEPVKTTSGGGRGGKRNLAQLAKKGNPMEMEIERTKSETKPDPKIETKMERETSVPTTVAAGTQKMQTNEGAVQNLQTSMDGKPDRKSSSSNLFGALANAPLFAMGTSSNNNSSSGNNTGAGGGAGGNNPSQPATSTATTTVSSASKSHNSISVATAGLTTVVSTVSSTSTTSSSGTMSQGAAPNTFSHSYENFLTESLKRATREPLSPELQPVGPRKRSK